MRRSRIIIRTALGLVVALLLCGCTPDFASRDPARGDDPLGYYEVRQEQGVYVLGSMASAEKAKAGKVPAKTIRRLSRGGVPVYFEVDTAGLEYRLVGEYSRRHGLSE